MRQRVASVSRKENSMNELKAQLIKCMQAELDELKKDLLKMQPQEILDRTYEYAMKTEIIYAAHDSVLDDHQIDALLKHPSPLNDVYSKYLKHDETSLSDELANCLAEEAQVRTMYKPDIIPLYRKDSKTAKERNELSEWRASFRENANCAKALDNAMKDNFADNRMDTKKVLETVVAEYGFERTAHILAAQVYNNDWDGRYRKEVKNWAKEQMKDFSADFIEKSRDYYLNSHPILIDGVAKRAMTDEEKYIGNCSKNVNIEDSQQEEDMEI